MVASFYVVDGHGYSYQSFFAIQHLSTAAGTPTNAVFGFAKFLDKIFAQKPDYLAICFDAPGAKFRQAMFSDYKATRKPMPDELRPQIALIKELLQAYGIATFELAGHEADDLMATLARQVAGTPELQTYLVTQDKDMLQLVGDTVKVYDSKGDLVLDEQEVTNRWQLLPKRLPDYFALIGDAADNIPGIKGIGKKTALALLAQWDNLEEIYHHLGEVKPEKVRKLLEENRDNAFLSRKLFLLEDQAPIEFSLANCQWRPGGDRERLKEFFRKLEFQSLLHKLEAEPVNNAMTNEPTTATPMPVSPCKLKQNQQEFDW